MVLWRLRKTVSVTESLEASDASPPTSEASAPAQDTAVPSAASPPPGSADPITAVRRANMPDGDAVLPVEGRTSVHPGWRMKRPQRLQPTLKSKRTQISQQHQPKPSRPRSSQQARPGASATSSTKQSVTVTSRNAPEQTGNISDVSTKSTTQVLTNSRENVVGKTASMHRNWSQDAKLTFSSGRFQTSDLAIRGKGFQDHVRTRRGSIAFPVNGSTVHQNQPNVKQSVRPKSGSPSYRCLVQNQLTEESLSSRNRPRSRLGSRAGRDAVGSQELSARSPTATRCPSPQPAFASEYIAEIFQTSDKFLMSRPGSGRPRPASARPPIRPKSAQPRAQGSAPSRGYKTRPASAMPRTNAHARDTDRHPIKESSAEPRSTLQIEKNLTVLLKSPPRSGSLLASRNAISVQEQTDGDADELHTSKDAAMYLGDNLEQQEHRNLSSTSTYYTVPQGHPSSTPQTPQSLPSESPSPGYHRQLRDDEAVRTVTQCSHYDPDDTKQATEETSTSYPNSMLIPEGDSFDFESQTVTSSRPELASDRLQTPDKEESTSTTDQHQDINREETEGPADPVDRSAQDSYRGCGPAGSAKPRPRTAATRRDMEVHFRREKQAVLDDLRSDLGRRLKLRKKSGIMSDTVFQKQIRSSFWTADMLYHRWGKDLLEMRNKRDSCTGRLSDQSDSSDDLEKAPAALRSRGRRFAFSNERTEKDSPLDFEALRYISKGQSPTSRSPFTDTPISESPTGSQGHPALRRTATTGSLRSTPPLSRQGSKVEVRPQATMNLADVDLGLRLTAHLNEDPEARRIRLRALFIATVAKVMRIARVAICMIRSSKDLNVANFMAQIHFYNTRTMEEELTFEKEKFSRKYSKLHVPNWAREIGLKPPWERTPDDVTALYSILKNLRSFEKFTHQMRMEICRAATYSCCEKGRVILRQGHVGHNFYFIFSGSVLVQIDIVDTATGVATPSKTAVMEKGSSFGELALLGGGTGRRRASIICRETTELFEIEKETFLELCPDIFERELQEKIAAARNFEIFRLFPDDVLERLCFESFIAEVAYDRVIDRDTAHTDTIYFILDGKVTMLKEFDLSHAYRNTTIEAYGDMVLPTPKPGPDADNRGRKTLPQATDKNKCFMRVGELRNGDCTEIALMHASENRTSPGVILLSNGVRIMQMSKRKLEQFAPREVLDMIRKQPVQPLRIPTSVDLYKMYLGDVNWTDFKTKVVDTLHQEMEGAPIVGKPSTAKGSTGWSRWPGTGATGPPRCAELAPDKRRRSPAREGRSTVGAS